MMAESEPLVLLGICAILAGLALLLIYFTIPDPFEYKGNHRGDHTRTRARIREAQKEDGKEEGGADRERREDEGRTFPHGEEGGAHPKAARTVRVLLEDGPFDGEYCEITPETWRAGALIAPERVLMGPVVDVHPTEAYLTTAPRMGRYVRRKYGHRLDGFRYRWMWDGWA